MRKPRRIAVIAQNATKVRRKPRKKGEIAKLKIKLWELCRQLTKKEWGDSCYTCGRVVTKGMHTGHYITSSTCSIPLRYEKRNLKPQCYHCNINLSGNWPSYMKRMESEHPGITFALTEINEATKGKTYNKEWFERKIAEYQAML